MSGIRRCSWLLLRSVVVLEWFNPDCPFTQRHHVTKSTMVDLANKYAGKGVVWLAVNSTHYMGAKASKKAHNEWKLPYPVLGDRGGAVGRSLSAKAPPPRFLAAPDGRDGPRRAGDVSGLDRSMGRAEQPVS